MFDLRCNSVLGIFVTPHAISRARNPHAETYSMMKFVTKAAGSLAVVALVAAASAYAQAPAGGDSLRLLVTSSAFTSRTDLDDKFTQNGDNMSPPISWSKGPAGTQSYAVLAEDSGVNRKDPIVHWIIFNIPSTTYSLPQNVP